VGLLVERIDVAPDGIQLRLRLDGLGSLAGELGLGVEAAAA